MTHAWTHHMREHRGTVILCDHLYPSLNGKWVIAGTYTNWQARPGERHLDLPGLNVYVRFQVEKAGTYDCELLLIHRALPSNAPAILRQQVRIEVIDPLTPCEVGCVLPAFRVRCPNVPDAQAAALIGVPLLVWFKVSGEDVASCPLNVIFQPNQGHGHAGDPAKQSDSGR